MTYYLGFDSEADAFVALKQINGTALQKLGLYLTAKPNSNPTYLQIDSTFYASTDVRQLANLLQMTIHASFDDQTLGIFFPKKQGKLLQMPTTSPPVTQSVLLPTGT